MLGCYRERLLMSALTKPRSRPWIAHSSLHWLQTLAASDKTWRIACIMGKTASLHYAPPPLKSSSMISTLTHIHTCPSTRTLGRSEVQIHKWFCTQAYVGLPLWDFVWWGVTEEIVRHWLCVVVCEDLRLDARNEQRGRWRNEKDGEEERRSKKICSNLIYQYKSQTN